MELDYPYSNHMVLQRNKDIILSGTSEEKEVKITFLDKEYKVPVNDGRWQISFKIEKPGGPYCMVLTDDRDTLVLDDILVGDVYLAAGQSNMELEMRESKEKKLPSYRSNVRIMTVPKYIYPFEDDNQRWKELNEETVSSFSAVASFFSYYLDEDIPIGIISNNKGGTSASCWIEEEVLKSNNVLKENVYDPYYDDLPSLDIQKEETEKYYNVFNNYQKELKECINTHPDMTLSQIKNIVGHTPWPPPKGYYDYRRPGSLYEHMFKCTLDYPVKAVLWYQGEEDSPQYMYYSELLKTLIQSWRRAYHEDFPFFIIQLPEYKNSHFDEIRRVQRDVVRSIKDTYLVTTLKTGDPDYIHPASKEEVGKRLAYSVAHYLYEKNTPVTPILDEETLIYDQDMKENDVHLIVDGHACIGHIKNRKLIIPVQNYHMLAYANDDNPKVEIESVEGIPASPFRIKR